MIVHRMLTLAAAAFLGGPGAAAAQACLGIPSRDGTIAVAAAYGIDDEIGGEFHADVSGPAAFGFAYRTGVDDGEPSSYEFRAAYDFYLVEPAICAVAGIRFTDSDASDLTERLGIPVGLGIGKTVDTGRFATTVYAIPQYMWVREVRTAAGGAEDVDTSNAFTGEAGLTLGILPFYVNGAVSVSTLDDDPTFRIRFGLLF